MVGVDEGASMVVQAQWWFRMKMLKDFLGWLVLKNEEKGSAERERERGADAFFLFAVAPCTAIGKGATLPLIVASTDSLRVRCSSISVCF